MLLDINWSGKKVGGRWAKVHNILGPYDVMKVSEGRWLNIKSAIWKFLLVWLCNGSNPASLAQFLTTLV